jgi:hypothetical protein
VVCELNPAASVKGVKETVLECETPEITLEQSRTLLASRRVAKVVGDGRVGSVETPLLVRLRDRAIIATLAYQPVEIIKTPLKSEQFSRIIRAFRAELALQAQEKDRAGE